MNLWLGLDRLLFLLTRLFLRLFTRVNCLPREASDLNLDTGQSVVYILRDSSLTDLIAMEREALALGLPSPMASQPALGLARSHLHVYRRQSWFSRQRISHDPPRLARLVEQLQQQTDKDVQLVPVSLFWGRRPDKEGSIWKIIFSDNWSPPGFLKKFLVVMTQGRQLYIQFSAPMSLRQLIDEQQNAEITRRKALRILRVHFRRQREAAIGPDLSHRRTLVNSLIQSSSVQHEITQTAKQENIKKEKVEARARRYAMEIAADYSHTVIRFLEVVLSWVWNRLYSGLRIYHLDKLHKAARDHEIVYVPCHRSHADYLLLSYILYRNGLMPPHIAAGINLDMPVIGSILRRGGAFFMRRTFKGNNLYQAIFNEYMHNILIRGFSLEYFVEGGRSRSGRMLKPKTGMLAMTVRSYLRDAEKPIAFVPTYIGYEKVIENRSYIGELHGKQKQKESVGGFLRSLSILRSKFGEVHVSFGEPVILSDFLDQQDSQWRNSEIGAEPPEWFRNAVAQLGDTIVTRINAAAVANPVNLLSLALLATPKQTMDEQQLHRQLSLYLQLLKQAPYSPLTTITCSQAEDIINYGLNNDFVQRIEHRLGSLITTDASTALQMTYVRNNSLHLFVLPGLISSLLLNARSLQPHRLQQLIKLLYPFFQSEYLLHWETDQEIEAAIEQTLHVMIEQSLVVHDNGELAGAPVHTLEAELLQHLGQTVQQALERYYLTIRVLVQYGSNALDTQTLEELAHQSAQRLSLLYEFNSPEFSDRAVLRNFIGQLVNHQLVTLGKENGKLCFDDRLESLDNEARRILGAEVRQQIQRLTRQKQALKTAQTENTAA